MEQSPEDGNLFPTTNSSAWNYLQMLGACVSGRLGRFSRTGAPHARPMKRGNNASLIEIDLDRILRTTLSVHYLTKDIFEDMDEAGLDLLRSLNTMVNLPLITSEGASTNWKDWTESKETEDDHVMGLTERVETATTLQTNFAHLHRLMKFLTSPRIGTDQRQFSLTTGLYPLFVLSLSDSGDSAMDSLTRWSEVLETLQGGPRPSDDCSFVPLEPMQESRGQEELDQNRGESVSNVVQDMFKEFRQLRCFKTTTHEIRLHVTDDLYSGRLGDDLKLETFISCCPGSAPIWQNAECGKYSELSFVDPVRHCICDRISWAMHRRRKLYIKVNSKGMFDVTDRFSVNPLSRDSFDGTSLSELLKQGVFKRIDVEAYLDKTAAKRVDSTTKARVALGLSRCLMDFFDKGLELATHSWIADNVHFREDSANEKEINRRLLYVSLRPNLDQNAASDMVKMFDNGSPVVLSFAKLLLEILYGKALKIQVNPDEKENLSSWLKLGGIVQDLRRNPDGGPFTTAYLEVVDNCLSLWATLCSGDDRTDPLGTIRFVRKIIYEKIVHKLEIISGSEPTTQIHERSKRKTQDPMLNEPPAKKVAHSAQIPFVYRSSGLINGQNPVVSNGDFVTAARIEDSEQATEDDDAGNHGRLSLYDEQGKTNEREQKAAEEHLKDLINSMGRYIKPQANSGRDTKKPIKVAIIDSGINLNDSWISGRISQIGLKRNWTSSQVDDWADECGHGTHIARLISRIAPAAEIYIAKVSKRKKCDPEVAGQVAQAIEWAVGVWKVDIISLSMAMDGEEPRIKKALDKVLTPPHDSPKKVVVMAAASNWGGNRHIGFPASSKGVICIHSTDGYRNPSNTNPTAQKGKDFAVLGMSIESSIKVKDKPRTKVYISGTSYATAVGVGIAANVLEVAKGDPILWDEGKGKLCSSWGMSCVFRIMSERRADYRNVMPWRLFDGRPEAEIHHAIRSALEPDV